MFSISFVFSFFFFFWEQIIKITLWLCIKGTGGSKVLMQNNKWIFSVLKGLIKRGSINWLNISFYFNIDARPRAHKNPVHLKEVHIFIASFWTNSPLVLLLSRALCETDIASIVSILLKMVLLLTWVCLGRFYLKLRR